MQLDTVTLPDNFVWVNEYDWSPVAQETDRSVTGAFIVSEQQKSYGRPIVLGDGENSWLTRDQLGELFILSASLHHKMLLTLVDGRSFTVIFDHTESAPIEARQVLPLAAPSDRHYYTVVIRLLTIAPD